MLTETAAIESIENALSEASRIPNEAQIDGFNGLTDEELTKLEEGCRYSYFRTKNLLYSDIRHSDPKDQSPPDSFSLRHLHLQHLRPIQHRQRTIQRSAK